MTIGLIGRKRGMTRIFREDGRSVPVTVIELEPNKITQKKDIDSDGYRAIQITTGTKRASRVNKAAAGIYEKANVEAGRGCWEFRLDDGEGNDLEVGGSLTVTQFKDGQVVDVTGTSKGKGFAGVIKRYNFQMQDATHGNSLAHRAPGSIGQCQTPGRVFKGKKMCGHMGNARVTTQNLRVERVDEARNLLLIKGAVPGSIGSDVIVKPAAKAASGS